ncbi:hypothetical protein PG993_004285 [Apiospora rasikravindrae]|uniref:Uncharacterized protein n=1 Tax=Apiospora rasikravindrae TaxID=990691 RepID=A0ABR1TCC9_9PEZI
MQFTFATSVLLAGLAAASPIERRVTSAVDMVLTIAPNSKTCDGSADCRTAVQAAPFMIQSFQDYKVYAAGQIAGVLALMAFESGDFKYKHNVSPGRPGQGTANMQMYPNNLKYAASIPDLKAKASSFNENSSDAQKNELLAMVTDDKYNFGSGAWYLTTQCDKATQTALAAGDDAGFAAYMKCVGVTVTDDRNAYWQRAKKAFSL